MLEEELRYRLHVEDAEDGSSCTVRLRDQFLNYAFSDQLKAALRDACRERIDRGIRRFALDLTAVGVMDSCGLSVVIGLRKLVEEASGQLVVVTAAPMLLRLFAITRLDSVFRIVPTLDAAREALAAPASAPAA